MSQTILQNGYAILSANTSDIDKILLAQDFLIKRIDTVRSQKTQARDDSLKQRLADLAQIESIINSSTTSQEKKLYLAQVRSQLSKQIDQLDRQNINPTYDDLRKTHAFFINQTYKPIVSVAYGYSNTQVDPIPIFNTSTKFKIPVTGDFFADMVIHMKLSSFQATHPSNKVRYCDFPGHRIFKEIRFVVDGMVLDRYGPDEINFFYDFKVSRNQRPGWNRCVGQSNPHRGIFIQDPTNQEVHEEKMLYDGFQTLKRTQDEMNIYLPLQFWFCDPKFAISNFNITFDKFFIEIDIANINDIVSITDYANDGGLFTPPNILDCRLYTNHIYTIPEVAELFKHTSQYSIVRVHKKLERIIDKPYDSIILNDLKFAIEDITFCFRPMENDTNLNRMQTWRMNNALEYKQLAHPSVVTIGGNPSLAATNVYYYKVIPAVDYISLMANSSTIYDTAPSEFYDSYLPYKYGREKIVTPCSNGSYLMTFALDVMKDQPSGYMNLSTSNENYLTYSSSWIDNDHPAKLVLCARAINFLLISNGGITLRFAV